MCGPTAIIGIIEQDYCYKSVPNQIPHDAGLAPIRFAGIQTGTVTDYATAANNFIYCIIFIRKRKQDYMKTRLWSRKKCI